MNFIIGILQKMEKILKSKNLFREKVGIADLETTTCMLHFLICISGQIPGGESGL